MTLAEVNHPPMPVLPDMADVDAYVTAWTHYATTAAEYGVDLNLAGGPDFV